MYRINILFALVLAYLIMFMILFIIAFIIDTLKPFKRPQAPFKASKPIIDKETESMEWEVNYNKLKT
jgi:hypothetical protein